MYRSFGLWTVIPYLTSKNIGSGRLKLDNLDYVSVEDFERLFSSTSAAIGDRFLAIF